jgi:hypothetical protein
LLSESEEIEWRLKVELSRNIGASGKLKRKIRKKKKEKKNKKGRREESRPPVAYVGARA